MDSQFINHNCHFLLCWRKKSISFKVRWTCYVSDPLISSSAYIKIVYQGNWKNHAFKFVPNIQNHSVTLTPPPIIQLMNSNSRFYLFSCQVRQEYYSIYQWKHTTNWWFYYVWTCSKEWQTFDLERWITSYCCVWWKLRLFSFQLQVIRYWSAPLPQASNQIQCGYKVLMVTGCLCRRHRELRTLLSPCEQGLP